MRAKLNRNCKSKKESGFMWIRSGLFCFLMIRIRDYLRIKPVSTSDALKLYRAYFLSMCWWSIKSNRFRTVGQFLQSRNPLKVKLGELVFFVRPHSEDLGYLTSSHKPVKFGDDWTQLKKGDLFVDVGANIGYFSILASSRGANVVSVEPDNRTFQILMGNKIENKLTNMVLHNIAAGEKEDRLLLNFPSFGSGLASLNRDQALHDSGGNGDFVNVVPLDRITEQYTSIDLIMIDVEGYEYEVLLGARETIKKTKRLIIEIWHSNREKCIDFLQGNGYNMIERRPCSDVNEYYLFENGRRNQNLSISHPADSNMYLRDSKEGNRE